MGWAKDLQRIADKSAVDIEVLSVGVKVAIFSDVVFNTRVDTGRLKGNWQIQNNKYTPRTLTTFDKTKKVTMSANSSFKIERGSLPSSITYFTNNLPYAEAWEIKDGMIAKAISKARQDVKEQARKLR